MSIINTSLLTKIKKKKADKSNVLELDNLTSYEPSSDYNPATKLYVDEKINEVSTSIDYNNILNVPTMVVVTTEKTLIQNNTISLDTIPLGDLIWNKAIIYDDVDSNLIVSEVTCSTEGNNVLFDSNDNVNGKYCVVSYFSMIQKT